MPQDPRPSTSGGGGGPGSAAPSRPAASSPASQGVAAFAAAGGALAAPPAARQKPEQPRLPSGARLEPAGDLFCSSADEDTMGDGSGGPAGCAFVQVRTIRARDVLPGACASDSDAVPGRPTLYHDWSPADGGQDDGGGTGHGAQAASPDQGRAVVASLAAEDTEVRDIVIPQVTIAQLSETLARPRPGVRDGGGQTTLMLQRISYDLDEDGVRGILERKGFACTFDALYVPRNPKRGVNLGYGFVNFVREEYAAACIVAFSGRPFGGPHPLGPCSIEVAKRQGSTFMLERMTRVQQRHQERAKRGGVASLQSFQ